VEDESSVAAQLEGGESSVAVQLGEDENLVEEAGKELVEEVGILEEEHGK